MGEREVCGGMSGKLVNMTIFDYLDYDIKSFKNNPPTKIGSLKANSTFSKKYIRPIFEHVKSLKSEKEIEGYFENTFYFGRGDPTPYAEFWRFIIGERGCRIMLTVDRFSDFVFVLNHHGRIYGGHVPLDNLQYPPNMTSDDYRESLSVDDIKAIIEDSKRICRLVRNSSSRREFANSRLKDYGIDYLIHKENME